jgi:hypothetical protein
MVFKNLTMKKILLILLMCFNYTSFSQELVRVIDTVLVLDLSSSTDISSKVYGQQISPPTSKIWKIQNIIFDPGMLCGVNFCQSYTGAIPWDAIHSFIELNDGVNSSYLCSSQPSGQRIDVEQCFENVIWVNSSSSISIGIAQIANNGFAYCINGCKITAHVSILEFEN